MQTAFSALSVVMCVFAAVLVFQAAAAALCPRFDGLPVPAGVVLGPAALARALDGSPLRISAIALFWALCLCLIELRSLVSRGYSLRILVDLDERGGSVSASSLKSGYGGGLGLRGLLKKRLAGLERCGLLRLEGARDVELTRAGLLLGGLGRAARRFLRMETVG